MRNFRTKEKKFKVSSDWNLEDADDYRLKPPFKDYCAKVRSVLALEPVTVGEIKRRLGADLNDKWLQEALNTLKIQGQAHGTEGEYLDTYIWAEPVKVKKEKGSLDMSSLFGKNGRKVKEMPRASSIYPNSMWD